MSERDSCTDVIMGFVGVLWSQDRQRCKSVFSPEDDQDGKCWGDQY